MPYTGDDATNQEHWRHGRRRRGNSDLLPVRIVVPIRLAVRCGKWSFGIISLLLALLYLRRDDLEERSWSFELGTSPLKGDDDPMRFLASVAVTSGSSGSASIDEDGLGHGHGPAIPHSLDSMLAICFFGFVICLALEHCNRIAFMYLHWQAPISCLIFISGMFVERLVYVLIWYKDPAWPSWRDSGFENLLWGSNSLRYLDPHALFFLILPPLLYESASAMSWHVLKKVLPSAIVLAGPGVLVNVGLTGLFVFLIVKDNNGGSFNVSASLLLASILSATDPVAVVCALRQLGAPPKLSSLVEGESLLNDGTAFVLFLVFKDMVAEDAPDDEKMCPGKTPEAFCIFLKFIQLALGGTVFGLAVGYVTKVWIGYVRFYHSAPFELTIIIVAMYSSFFVAEKMHMSGVLAVVMFGFTMAASILPVLSHDARHAHHMVMAQIGYLCDRLIFFAAGIVSMRFLAISGGTSWNYGTSFLHLFILYIVVHFTRTVVIAMFSPVLARMGYGLKPREGMILIYGGLRGAVGLAMGLMIEHEMWIKQEVSMVIAFHASGIVLLTMVINGTTVTCLYGLLELYPVNQYKVRHIKSVLRKVEHHSRETGIAKLMKHWFFRDVHFSTIEQCLPNFRNVEFDQAGRPYCQDIAEVAATLKSLEEETLESRKVQLLQDYTMKEPMEAKFERRNQELAETLLAWLDHGQENQDTITSSTGLAGDVMMNMLDTVEEEEHKDSKGQSMKPTELLYRITNPSGKLKKGFYVSRRPLTKICETSMEQGDDLEISLEVNQMQNVSIVFGMVQKNAFDKAKGAFANHTVTEDDAVPFDTVQLLGDEPGSLGIACDTGELRVRSTEALGGSGGLGRISSLETAISETTSTMVGGEMKVGERIIITAKRESCCNCELIISRQESVDTEPHKVHSCTLGAAMAGELYPVIEMIPTEGVLAETSRASIFGKTHSERSDADLHEEHNMALPGQNQSEKKNHLGVTGDIRRASLSSGSTFIVGAVRDAAGATKEKHDRHARVTLNFIPQIVQSHASLHEIFIVLFNTVTRQYNKMHDHGQLGHFALQRLLLSTADGKDCANCEYGAKQVRDFVKVPGVSAWKRSSSTPLVLTEKLRKIIDAIPRLSAHSNPRDLSMLTEEDSFEPVIVEYLCICSLSQEKGFFDRFPKSWHWTRNFGYSFTRTKVESLFAYIECHNTVIKQFEILDRFPKLKNCLEGLVQCAKKDLQIIEQINPVRHFYTKHYLALRIMLSNRLEKLEKSTSDGWIATSDAEGLIEELHHRIMQVEYYYPSLTPLRFDSLKKLGRSRSGEKKHTPQKVTSSSSKSPSVAEDLNRAKTAPAKKEEPSLVRGESDTALSMNRNKTSPADKSQSMMVESASLVHSREDADDSGNVTKLPRSMTCPAPPTIDESPPATPQIRVIDTSATIKVGEGNAFAQTSPAGLISAAQASKLDDADVGGEAATPS